jgi:hypothetical protein
MEAKQIRRLIATAALILFVPGGAAEALAEAQNGETSTSSARHPQPVGPSSSRTSP